MQTVRVRIAPSPTGNLHIGTARAALFNYLFAKKHGGVFVLRIEDTDVERSDKKYEQNIFDGLRWLGIDPDEGPLQGGPCAPYRQTERIETYQKHLDRLFDKGFAFYCFHTKEELKKEQEELLKAKRPPLHLCEYRVMDSVEAKDMSRINTNHVIRFKTPAGKRIVFHDLIRGEIAFETDLLGDFSIARRRDMPLYHFAVVVDDIEMQITHIIRGEDHIPNTPKHLLLFEALGFAMPQFAHLPLLLGSDRSKLSKRHGATSLEEYRAAGYLPDALVNFMALLGWNPGGDREIFSKEELIAAFSLEKVQKSGAVFDTAKLDWMNGEYIRKKSVAELTALCGPYFNRAALIESTDIARPYGLAMSVDLEKVVALEQPRLKKLSEIGERTAYFFRQPEYDKKLLGWRNMTDENIKAALDLCIKIYEEKIIPKGIKSARQLQDIFFSIETRILLTLSPKIGGLELGGGHRGFLLWPLRAALTGRKASPGPFEIMEILGVDESLARIRAAKKKLK